MILLFQKRREKRRNGRIRNSGTECSVSSSPTKGSTLTTILVLLSLLAFSQAVSHHATLDKGDEAVLSTNSKDLDTATAIGQNAGQQKKKDKILFSFDTIERTKLAALATNSIHGTVGKLAANDAGFEGNKIIDEFGEMTLDVSINGFDKDAEAGNEANQHDDGSTMATPGGDVQATTVGKQKTDTADDKGKTVDGIGIMVEGLKKRLAGNDDVGFEGNKIIDEFGEM
eukprot:scaffold1922_cov291-Chaetoceros_neogracile.AAC.21